MLSFCNCAWFFVFLCVLAASLHAYARKDGHHNQVFVLLFVCVPVCSCSSSLLVLFATWRSLLQRAVPSWSFLSVFACWLLDVLPTLSWVSPSLGVAQNRVGRFRASPSLGEGLAKPTVWTEWVVSVPLELSYSGTLCPTHCQTRVNRGCLESQQGWDTGLEQGHEVRVNLPRGLPRLRSSMNSVGHCAKQPLYLRVLKTVCLLGLHRFCWFSFPFASLSVWWCYHCDCRWTKWAVTTPIGSPNQGKVALGVKGGCWYSRALCPAHCQTQVHWGCLLRQQGQHTVHWEIFVVKQFSCLPKIT